MKKNLRIVSAAAAALLAVAPVAATSFVAPATTVSAADSQAVTTATELGQVGNIANNGTVNVKPSVSLNTDVPGTNIQAAISVSFSATVNGTTATSTFNPGKNGSNVSLFHGKQEIKDLKDVSADAAGSTYRVVVTNVGLNFGTQNANKKITLAFPDGDSFTWNGKEGSSNEVTLDQNGTIVLSGVSMNVTAKNFANPSVVTWFNKSNNAPVTSGNIELYAGSDAGKMNVKQVEAAAEAKYSASNEATNSTLKENSHIKYSSNIKDALKAMNIDVDPQGWFVAPKSFTFNMTATANNNDASAVLPVTVTVPNGKEVTPSTVASVSKRIMHNAYYYDKDAKRVGTDSVKRYASVSVLPNTTTIKGKAYYQVVENGKAVDKYINAANIDGTKRTLKHNAYVYASSKKRANKVVLKKGEVVTTYGAAYTFKNGKSYYKIGDNTDKTYVKVANFR